MSDEAQNKKHSETRPAETPLQNSSSDDSTRSGKEIPAIRHVGPSLDADPEYRSTQGYSTPEAQIADEAGQVDAGQTRMTENDFDALSGRTPEGLKTRLPGDTSSDPHSDAGPDNAANLRNRPDSGKSNRA